MRYVVLDLETSGLNPTKDQILELGAIAVDEQLAEIARVSYLAHFPPSRTEEVSAFVRDMHAKNGLWEDIDFRGGLLLADIDTSFSKWLLELGATKESVVLAGHSIHFDHGFIKAQLLTTSTLLSHRLMDFGALNRFMLDCGLAVRPTPEMPHRAMADCEIELEGARAMRAVLREVVG